MILTRFGTKTMSAHTKLADCKLKNTSCMNSLVFDSLLSLLLMPWFFFIMIVAIFDQQLTHGLLHDQARP